MKFEICFNQADYYNDKFLIEKLGAYEVPTGSTKYPPFEKMEIEIKDFEELEQMLKIVDKEFNTISSAVISFDSPTIFIDFYQKK